MFVSVTASLSLAYNELSIDSKKRDEKLKNLDPKKKAQVERLGMGGGSVRQVFTHSSWASYWPGKLDKVRQNLT